MVLLERLVSVEVQKTKQESQQRAEIKYLVAGLTFSLIFPPSSRFNFILLKGTEIIDIIPTVVRGQCVPTTTHNTFRRVLPHCSLKDEFHQRFFKSIFRILYIIIIQPFGCIIHPIYLSKVWKLGVDLFGI